MGSDKILHRGILNDGLAVSIFGRHLPCHAAAGQIDTAARRCSGITFCFRTVEGNCTVIGFHISFQFAILKTY